MESRFRGGPCSCLKTFFIFTPYTSPRKGRRKEGLIRALSRLLISTAHLLLLFRAAAAASFPFGSLSEIEENWEGKKKRRSNFFLPSPERYSMRNMRYISQGGESFNKNLYPALLPAAAEGRKGKKRRNISKGFSKTFHVPV